MSHREACPPRARPRAPPLPLASRPAARARIGWAAPGGRGREEEEGAEACEQSVISGCSGRRRKRELGIAAPSPFPYFLSSAPAPARPPARGGAAGAAANRSPVRTGRREGWAVSAPEAPAPSQCPLPEPRFP